MNERERLLNQVELAIKTVYDPELPVNIWELGLIYDIQLTESNEVVVLMTLTAPNCPEAEGIPVEVEERIKTVQGIKDAKVILTFDPPWTKDLLSEVARFELGMF